MSELEIIQNIIGLFDGSNTLFEWLNVVVPLFGYVLAVVGAFAYRGLVKELYEVLAVYRDTKLEESDRGRKTSKNEMKKVAKEGYDVIEEFIERHQSFTRLIGRWWRKLKGIFT